MAIFVLRPEIKHLLCLGFDCVRVPCVGVCRYMAKWNGRNEYLTINKYVVSELEIPLSETILFGLLARR